MFFLLKKTQISCIWQTQIRNKRYNDSSEGRGIRSGLYCISQEYIENGERNEGWNLLQGQYRKEHTGDIS